MNARTKLVGVGILSRLSVLCPALLLSMVSFSLYGWRGAACVGAIVLVAVGCIEVFMRWTSGNKAKRRLGSVGVPTDEAILNEIFGSLIEISRIADEDMRAQKANSVASDYRIRIQHSTLHHTPEESLARRILSSSSLVLRQSDIVTLSQEPAFYEKNVVALREPHAGELAFDCTQFLRYTQEVGRYAQIGSLSQLLVTEAADDDKAIGVATSR
jgi:hypothetical protein